MLANPLPVGNSWGYRTSNCETPTATYGTLLTGNATVNTPGNWTSCITSLAHDVYAVKIEFTDNNTNATARSAVSDIGIDPSGGTSYTPIINNLIHSQAGGSAIGGVGYNFPLFIPAGARIGARTTQLTASGTCRVMINVYGKPSRPDLIAYGTKIITVGTKLSGSTGQSITCGNSNAESAYISLGVPSITCWWWQLGYGVAASSTTAINYYLDLARGDATTKVDIIKNKRFVTGTTETINAWSDFQGWGTAGPESTIYVRGSASGTAQAAHTLAYGLG